MKNKCMNCEERKLLLANDIYACHSFCKAYMEFRERVDKANENRQFEVQSNDLKDRAYGRTTRGLYEKYRR